MIPSLRGREASPKALTRAARNKELRPTEDSAPSAREARILRAVIEELARSDYGGLTFDRVAARAGVNKTTVYRHWETKAELVQAALTRMVRSITPELSTGTLREDLIRIGRRMVEFSTSFEGQSLIRLHMLQHPEPELAGIAKELQASHLAHLAALGEAATARGELPAGVDFRLLLDMLGGTLHVRIFLKNETVDDVLIARVVDVLLRGVGATDGARARVRRAKTRR